MENIRRLQHFRNASLLSTTQAAAWLGVSYWTLLRLIADERIKAIKINGRWKIPTSSLESFVFGSEIAAPTELTFTRQEIEYSEKLKHEIMGGGGDE
ncbi:helix-turn-helix domain-containing protein [Methanogenium organophilum]|uniref:Helix-turn-helix domain-containing protein n=1 Tax=Methanogenium organophilum TaxID=2199 RepID=A0A9X9S3R8_METOG|nr:helix-turn-helix domain-containing protein [Methanogenium organophilum]WAI00958.1 helix-turn-helix domain-containing protein [Methanogenium organophilum]